MGLESVRFVNVILASILTGNELGTWAAVHPALRTLPAPEQIRAEQAVTRRYGRMMSALMISVIISCFAALRLIPERRSLPARTTLAATGCYTGMLSVTLLGNIPLNKQTLRASREMPPAQWAEILARWNGLHTVRVILNVAGLCLLYAGLMPTSRNTKPGESI